MLTAIDYEKGTTQMAFLEPKVFKVKNVDEYTCTQVTINIDNINPVDMIDFHRQTNEL